jgi:tetratricopeptide (TPR) repeat protein
VSTIALRLAATERSRTPSAGTGDHEAYGLLMRGQRLLLTGGRENNQEARRMYEKAIERDPEFARAYAGLSMTHILDWRYDWSPDPDQSLKSALELAKKAVAMDAGNARAHAALGFAYLYSRHTSLAVSCYERALALNPNDADIMVEFADVLTYDRRPAEAVKLIERAMRLNPYFPDWYLWYLGDAYYTLGRYEDAIATLQRMQDPTEGRRILAASYAQLGRIEEARAQAALVLKAQPGLTIREWAKKQPEQDPSELDHYLQALRLAGLPE